MELILNDLSLHGQFEEIDDFEDYFIEYLNKPIDLIIDQRIPLLKKQDTYNRKITRDITLDKYLKEAFNRSAATLMKEKIIKLAYYEPYWDEADELQSKSGIDYQYPAKQEIVKQHPDEQSEPNCFTEAIERKCPLLSIQKDNKAEEKIECYRDQEPVEIINITNVNTFLNAYLRDDIHNIRFAIEHYQANKTMKCAEVSGKCYTENALLENNLKEQDIQKFLDNIRTVIDDKSNGRKTHWWDSIKEDICEYRLSVSDGRELRVLFWWGEELVFLNGFIKKTEKTPPKEIKLAERIKNQWTQ